MDHSADSRPRLGWPGALLIVLVVALLLTAAGTLVILLVVNQRLNEVEETSHAIHAVSAPMEDVAAEFPFSPPEDGELDRARLYVFFEVINDVANEYGGSSGDASAERDGQLGALHKTIATSMRTREMGPAEFVWIANTAEAAWMKRMRGFRGQVPEANLRLVDAWMPRFDTLFLNEESPRYGVLDLIRAVALQSK